ncbi:MAG: hypothetical protein Kow00114_24530 [Kiloniellaceae bacterium]
MQISDSRQIPHQRLRPFFEFWNAQRGRRRWPRRDDITLDDLRAAAANTAFLRIDHPYRDLDSLRFVNVGTAVERATGQHLTGLTVGQLLRGIGSSPDFAFCFSEYGLAATEGCCSYNEGRFPWPNRSWLTYRRLVLPLGAGDAPDALFVVIDLNAIGLGLPLPETLSGYDPGDAVPSQPWPVPALRIAADGGNTPLD